MTTARLRVRGMGILGLALALGCGGETTGPEIPQGAGLAVVLPEGLGDTTEVRVELWAENVVVPTTCPDWQPVVTGRASRPFDDSCTLGRLWIRDLLGNEVRLREGVRWTGRIPGWDGLSDSGAEAPAGVYPVHWECEDSQNPFVFDGHYYVPSPEEPHACDWILWSATVGSAAGRRFEFKPFPVRFGVLSVVPGLGIPVSAFFENPYRLRVRFPGGRVFEREVTLIEKQFTEVRVDGIPAPAGGTRNAASNATRTGVR
jgi:hypothetical protein